jgi:hypothetical protein
LVSHDDVRAFATDHFLPGLPATLRAVPVWTGCTSSTAAPPVLTSDHAAIR